MRRHLRGFRAMIVGPPGSGKGFIANKIKNKYGCQLIATGDILRRHIENGTDVGKQAQRFIKKGKLVPDHLLKKLVNTSIFLKTENFLLDGYPRNLTQARDLETQTKLDFVINLNIPPVTILKRVKHRLIHPASGRVYSAYGPNTPRIEGHDDITGERLKRRIDDHPTIWYRRLKTYYSTMNPVIAYYSKKNLAVSFHVRQHENLWPQIKRYLRSKWAYIW